MISPGRYHTQHSRPLMLAASCACAALLALFAPCAAAQNYPNKPIRLIVAFPPGGSTDVLARIVGAKLGESWGQQVIVDNRPGAGTNIGTEMAAHAPADGYTLFMCTFTCAINPSLYSKLNYDLLKDFAPVSMVASVPLIVLVHPSVPVASIKELIALAKAKPGQLNYASFGNGTAAHLATELFKSMAGVDMTHVPYKGAAPAMNDLLGGQVNLMFESILTGMPHVRAGRLRALAVTSAKRLPRVSDIPTVAEAGVPGYEVDPWFGVVAPAATPPSVISKLNQEIVRIIKLPDVEERIASTGAFALGSTPQQLGAFMRAEVAKWGKVIRAIGVRAD
jgi:tripartite-type tricarboxylate transporter receptor subunit TctC